MPLQRRLPKFGFSSRKSLIRDEVRISVVNRLQETTVTLDSLRHMGVVSKNVKFAKLFGEAKLERAYIIRRLAVSKGARAAIEASGGKVEG